VVGKLHSYSDCARGDDVQLDLRNLQGIEVDAAGMRVHVQAGASIRAVCDALDRAGLALPWAGNYGEQTLVGAALTGTHGYARDGGLLAELIVAMTVIDGDGRVRRISDERHLRMLRVSFGALAAVVEVTAAVVPSNTPCRYHLWHVPSEQLFAELDDRTRRHDHFRCFPSRVLTGHHAILTIDRLPADGPAPAMARRVKYVDRGRVPFLMVPALRLLLRSPRCLALLGRTGLARAELDAVVPFSSYLFINAGITTGNHALARAIYEAWNDDRTRNASFGVATADYRRFHDLFFEQLRRRRRLAPQFSAYFTARYCGAQDRAVLAPSYRRGVLMVDVHVPRHDPGALEFLAELEDHSRRSFAIRPHWGKEIHGSRDAVCAQLPPGALDELRALKDQLDPRGTFSSPFTRRYLDL
jgi:FAD/FMN-containing dehydrogenase